METEEKVFQTDNGRLRVRLWIDPPKWWVSGQEPGYGVTAHFVSEHDARIEYDRRCRVGKVRQNIYYARKKIKITELEAELKNLKELKNLEEWDDIIFDG